MIDENGRLCIGGPLAGKYVEHTTDCVLCPVVPDEPGPLKPERYWLDRFQHRGLEVDFYRHESMASADCLAELIRAYAAHKSHT